MRWPMRAPIIVTSQVQTHPTAALDGGLYDRQAYALAAALSLGQSLAVAYARKRGRGSIPVVSLAECTWVMLSIDTTSRKHTSVAVLMTGRRPAEPVAIMNDRTDQQSLLSKQLREHATGSSNWTSVYENVTFGAARCRDAVGLLRSWWEERYETSLREHKASVLTLKPHGKPL